MGRLTDRATAEALKANAEKLRAAGIEPSEMDKRYIKLAEYENKERKCINCDYANFEYRPGKIFCCYYNDISNGANDWCYHFVMVKSERKEPLKGLYALDETPENNTRWLKCDPVTMQNRTPILTVDEIHKDPQRVKEAFEFFGLDEFISKRFTETR